jgi:hypothetical protein
MLVRRGRLHAGGHAGHGLRDRLEPVRRAAVRHEGRRLRQRPLERPRGSLLDDRGRPGRHRQQPDVHRPVLRRDEPAGSVVRVRALSPQETAASSHRTASTPTSTRSRSTRRTRPRSSRARTAA